MTSRKWIKGAVVGFPVGLFVLGTASMVYTQLKPEKPEHDANYHKRMQAASLNRTDINRPDLERYVRILSEEIGERHAAKPEALEKSAIWIESTLKGGGLGYTIERHGYPLKGGQMVHNIIAELPGTTRQDESVVIGAHYDTVVNCPGANDNGTGVAAVLALAKAYAGLPQKRTLRFAFFVNEEPPYFQTEQMGSLVYAKRQAARKDKIAAMLSVETIGCYFDKPGSQKYPPGLPGAFPDRGNFLAFVANEPSKFWADSARSAFMREAGIPAIAGAFPESIPGVGWSDQWSFWQAGYPGVMVTDTAPYRYPHYHKPTDTMDKVDFEKLEKACIGLKEVVEIWANP